MLIKTLSRWARHLWLDADDVRRVLTTAGLRRLEEAVLRSEARHLGELRVCVEAGLPPAALWQRQTPRARAIDLFSQLRVWDTEHNNGVLIYLLMADHRIEILADRGLHGHATDATWQTITDRLAGSLHAGEFEAGLTHAIEEVGALLKAHYPAGAAHPNPDELPNAVVLL